MDIVVRYELQHISGKFAARDDVTSALLDEINPGSLTVDETEYEITDVTEEDHEAVEDLAKANREIARLRKVLERIAAGDVQPGAIPGLASETLRLRRRSVA